MKVVGEGLLDYTAERSALRLLLMTQALGNVAHSVNPLRDSRFYGGRTRAETVSNRCQCQPELAGKPQSTGSIVVYRPSFQ
jgi:hypothetical protein